MKKFYLQSILLAVLFTCLLFMNTALAQTKVKVQGVVKTETGETLPGASVKVKDGKQGTMTNPKGEFTITVETGKLLVFNYVGYQPQAYPVTKAENVTITLQEIKNVMDEVVVIGYGSQKKSSVTGAVSKLKNDNLDEIPTSRLDNALIGKIAGVTIQNVSSEVGADPVVRVRGFSSISAGSQPLVVVDGYPVPDGLSFVNPQDVESIEVLKDAASSAIYGSRAANGVILITTKSGVSDKPRYTFKTYYGFKKPYELNPIMSVTEYTNQLFADAALRENDPTVPANLKNLITPAERAAYVIENQIAGGPTDWQREALQEAAIKNIQLGISGGKKDLKYYLSASGQKDEAVLKYSENTRLNVKAKVDGALSKKVTFSFNFNPSYIKTQRPAVNFTDYFRFGSFLPVYHDDFTAAYVQQNSQWANINAGDFVQARHFNGLSYSGLMPDGTTWNSNGPVEPFATSNNTPASIAGRENRSQENYRMLGGGDLSINILKGLIFKTSVGGYYTNQENSTFTLSNARKDGDVNEATIYNKQYLDFLWENTLNYTLTKGNHHFTGLLGYTTQQTKIKESNMVGRNFPTDNFKTLNQAGQIDQALTKTLEDRVGLISYLGRMTYDYKNKYLFSASFRTDGSSYFAKGQKYGSFPAVSAGWGIGKENFMKNVNWVSNLKLRASYGATGNNNIPSFSFVNLLYPGNYSFGSGTGSVGLGLSPNSDVLANPDITWERTFEFNSGIDFGFFKDRFSLTLEYYNAVTDRLLYKQSTQSFSGSFEYINNAGKIRNQGLELEFSANTIKNKNFSWTTSFNIAGNRNKLLELGGEPFQYNYGERNEIYAAIVGKPAIQFFGYQTDGIWTSQEEINAAKASGQTSTLSKYFAAGGLKYVDANGDQKIDVNDRVIIGSPFPDFTWGINNSFKYKGFDLNIMIQGVQGGSVINGDANYNESRKYNKNFTENRWISAAYPGDGKTPYYTNGENWLLTDYVIEDASYAALRNIIIGYSLPNKIAKKMGVNGVRLYSSIDNVLYLMGKSYRGINPEARTTSSAYASPLVSGYQRGAFPIARTYTFGLDVNF
ncbi:SusC/RagA family TonB-linked outer membrane protein [Pedobacter sp. PACM 27299]|uniref:SusC/RagA family TonB-linked outer membrane protein n=1 Tax=Pedobacter sp. PACM 27299 TaxID=1727164 RepID=UPI000706728F|nr:TonB-dependent receptor [Pedobacter sp. PACM 27299]ALL06094.1 SusC/RagA family TonB-linked outer membrane protein [Pedobacter sp. PACM 27299]